MDNIKFKEIQKSVETHIKSFGLEGAEEEIKKHYNGSLRKTMLFMLYDRLPFGERRKR